MQYLRFRKEALEKILRTELQALMRKILRYSLTDRSDQLLYTEINSIKSLYLIREEILKILSYMHNICEHYSDLITLNCLIEEVY